ncbi:hypothetical protein LPJ53_001323 [Coemansia erecta]|uniref:aminodeoxychorismate synthase n=1 Tax=Coemansia erecta TaxID=147472 RepID=A0A9W8CUQ0_9FUNG|nr:hypothetical protein LPJ53_001323 [Coemansia erecta]
MPAIAAEPSSFPRTLLVDNYDSYTFNLLHLLTTQCRLHNADPAQHILVIRNDQHPWATVRDRILPHIDNIVISPGPGTPERPEDFGICMRLITDALHRPVLGVCLGHQGIALAFGARVRRCAVPVHGQTSTIEVAAVSEGSGIFRHVPGRFSVVRYHSLAVSDEGFPHGELEVLARASGTVKAWADGRLADVATQEIMALRHRRRPLFGLQFHPESVCSEHGAQLVANFHEITCGAAGFRRHGGVPRHVQALSLQAADARAWRRGAAVGRPAEGAARWRLVERTVELPPACRFDAMFARLFGASRMPVWLDSADAQAGGGSGGMSVMASACGPGSATVRYGVASRAVEVLAFDEAGAKTVLAAERLAGGADGGSFWAWMQRLVDCTGGVEAAPLPAAFVGGWVGYFGYGMRAECMGVAGGGGGGGGGRLPDAQLAFVGRCVVVDHASRPPRAHVRALVANGSSSGSDGSPAWTAGLGSSSAADAQAWVSATCGEIAQWLGEPAPPPPAPEPASNPAASVLPLTVRPALSRSAYLAAIDEAKRLISRGESYEVCLTNRFAVQLPQAAAVCSARRMLALYGAMRRRNPAPFGALLWLDDLRLGVASCSPERFLCATAAGDKATGPDGGRVVEMRPIKGTCRRAPPGLAASAAEDARRREALRGDVKERAENLMIVDLIRHDLGWIARDGAVAVAALMDVESYATVHQMVSTVRAHVPPSSSEANGGYVGDVGVLAHCFPPGSMTGAPKRRTTQIIDALEDNCQGGRGVYSGCLGYFSACGGRSDWSVVIRTAVVEGADASGTCVSVGAGGALTALSDPKAEWAEVETKLHAALGGIEQYVSEAVLQ